MLLALFNVSRKWLHGFALAGNALAIGYCLQGSPNPLWVPLLWHSAFALVNTGQLSVAIFFKSKNKESSEKLDPLETFLKKTAFVHFPDKALVDLVQLGVEGRISKGEFILRMGQPTPEFYCILEGLASGMVENVKQNDYLPGKLIGEMLLIGQNLATQDIVANTDLKLLAWSTDSIGHWVGKDKQRIALLHAAVGAQIVDFFLIDAKKQKVEAAA